MLAALISTLTPRDALEAAHQADALAWLASTDDVYRRVKPATPPKHLVSYVVPPTRRPATCCWWTTAMRCCGSHPAGMWSRASIPR